MRFKTSNLFFLLALLFPLQLIIAEDMPEATDPDTLAADINMAEDDLPDITRWGCFSTSRSCKCLKVKGDLTVCGSGCIRNLKVCNLAVGNQLSVNGIDLVTLIGLANVIGAVGPQGIQGIAGVLGAIGAAGPQGAQGIAGVLGAIGAAGPIGAEGIAGALGAIGAAGPAGAEGIAGALGAINAAGAAGPAGAAGVAGAIGAVGVAGASGAVGATGATGIPGIGGVLGYAYIYSTSGQTIAIEADIPFDFNGIMSADITHATGSTQINIGTTGIYAVTFSVSGVEPSQFALYKNGALVAGSIYGSGAGTQLTTAQVLVAVSAGDILTIRNHSSAAAVTLQTLAGGTQTNTNASVLILRVA